MRIKSRNPDTVVQYLDLASNGISTNICCNYILGQQILRTCYLLK